MTGDVFRRLALVAGCSAWAAAIALVWVHVGWAAGLGALLAGPVGAVVLTLEPVPDTEPDEGPGGMSGRQRRRLPGFSRRDIEARARATRSDDDE